MKGQSKRSYTLSNSFCNGSMLRPGLSYRRLMGLNSKDRSRRGAISRRPSDRAKAAEALSNAQTTRLGIMRPHRDGGVGSVLSWLIGLSSPARSPSFGRDTRCHRRDLGE